MASIQQSLNNLFAASLGAGFAVTQLPGVQKMVAEKGERKQAERELEFKTKVAEEARERLETKKNVPEVVKAVRGEQYTKELEREQELALNLEIERAQAQANFAETYARHGKTPRTLERLAAEMKIPTKGMSESFYVNSLERLSNAMEAKKGLQKAVADRRSVIKQLREAGVNVDKVKGITDSNTGERVK